jgi:SAM-dependent methyltransferase
MKSRIQGRASMVARALLVKASGMRGNRPIIVVGDDSAKTSVDNYWNRHTVNSNPFVSAKESERYLKKRSDAYPLFAQLMDLYGDHTGQVVLDYGCGPGDDVVGFLLWSNARKVVGIDVSEKALELARHRVALHHIDAKRVELIKITDSTGKIPLPDETIDWLQCGGVLHHTTHPQEIVKEFYRVMRPGAEGRLMLYNRDSIWYHIWIAYAQLIVNNAYPGHTVDQAFTKSTDGPDCPVSDAWAPKRVLDLASAAGLQATFRGGYFNAVEMDWLKKYADGARTDKGLDPEHRQFASELQVDERGYPTWRAKYAGIGGVYTIKKPA